MLRHPYDTPTFKTNFLRLIIDEGQLKRLLLLCKRIIQSYLSLLWLQLAMHFAIFHTHDTPTFKTEALRLVCNEGQVKRLLLYKRLVQPYLSLFWL